MARTVCAIQPFADMRLRDDHHAFHEALPWLEFTRHLGQADPGPEPPERGRIGYHPVRAPEQRGTRAEPASARLGGVSAPAPVAGEVDFLRSPMSYRPSPTPSPSPNALRCERPISSALSCVTTNHPPNPEWSTPGYTLMASKRYFT